MDPIQNMADDISDQDYDDDNDRAIPSVYEIDGDLYQQIKRATIGDWESSGIWKRHTVSSKAKDWGIIRAHQSKPLPTLYQRGRNHEAVPAFKQYESEELERIVERIQRPTKSAMLRTGHCISDIPATGTEEGEKKDGEEGKKAEEKPPINQAALIKRLMTPTASQAIKVELTRKYRARPSEAQS